VTDIASLAVEVRTGDVVRARTELDKLTAAGGKAQRSAEQLTRTSAALATTLRGVVAGLGVRELIRLTDAHTKFTAQLKLATNGQDAFARAQDDVRRISKEAQADIVNTGTLYARIAKSGQQMNITQARVADITEVVALSLKASGASAQEAASATLQLSQAFASGVLRGEEFNAVNEAAPRLMQAIADGIGKPVGALRKMAENGELTARVLADSLPKALKAVRAEAAQIQTIGGSFTVLRNAMIEFVGTQAKASGAVSVLTRGVETLAQNLDTLAAAAIGFGAAKLAATLLTTANASRVVASGALQHAAAVGAQRAANIALAQSAVTATAAIAAQAAGTSGAVAAAAAHAAAQRTLATTVAASGVAMTAARGILAALGGPIGLISTLLGVGATAWLVYGNKAKEATEKTAEAARDSLRQTIRGTTDQAQKLADATAKARQAADDAGRAGDTAQQAAFTARANRLESLREGLNRQTQAALGAAQELDRQANADAFRRVERDPDQDPTRVRDRQREALGKFLESNQTKAEKFKAAIAKAREELGEFFNADVEKRIRQDIFGERAGTARNDGRLDALKVESEKEAAIFQSRNAALQSYYSATLIGEAEFLAGRSAARDDYISALQVQFAQERTLLEEQVRKAPADKRAEAQSELNKAVADYNEKLRALAESGAAEEIERIGKAKILAFEATQKAGKAEADNLTQLAAGNRTMREEIALLGATEEAKAAVEKARLRSIRTLKEERLAQLSATGVHETQLQALQLEIDLLREREELIDVRTRTVQAVEAREKDEELTKRLGEDTHREVRDALAAAFRDTENPARAFVEGLANVLYTRVSSRLADAMADSLVGKDGTSGLFGDILGSIFGSFTGGSTYDYNYRGTELPDSLRGGRASGGPTQRGGLYEVNENGPELYREDGKTYLMSGGGMVAPARSMPASGQSAPTFNLKFENAPQVESTQRRRNQTGGEDVLVRFVKEVARSTIDEDMSGNSGSAGSMSRRFGLNPAMGTMR
jgi:tape measure domain-containing protein